MTALPSLQNVNKKLLIFLLPLVIVTDSLISVYEEALSNKIDSEGNKI